MDDLRLFLRLLLGRGQFINDTVIGTVVGVAFGVFFKLFSPALAGVSNWIQPQSLSYFEWSFVGIALIFVGKLAFRVRRINDFKRETLDVIEELIERGELGKAQKKQIYQNLAYRFAAEIQLSGQPPTGSALEELIADEKNQEAAVEG